MSVFRDELAKDIDIEFLDLESFGEEHTIGAATEPITCVIDGDINAADKKGAGNSVTEATHVLYARESDIKRRVEGDQLIIDGVIYTVVDWRVDEGMHRVSLRSPRSYVGRQR